MMAARVLGMGSASTVTKARAGAAIVGVAVALGLLGDLLLRAWPWGVNLTLWLVALCVAALILPRVKSLDISGSRGVWWLAVAIAFSLTLMWRSSPVMQTLNAAAVFLCLAMVAFRPSGGSLRSAGIVEFGVNLGVACVHVLSGMTVLLVRHIEWRSLVAPERSPRLVAFVRGLALAAVPLVVFGALFASADVFFRDLLRDVLIVDLDELFLHLVLWLLFTWLAGGFLWGALLSDRETVPDVPRISWLHFELIEVGVVFGLVISLFALFVGVQFRYFFGGADRIASSSSLTYAEYARRGFFELVAVAALVVPFLLVTHWLLPRAQPWIHRVYAALAGVLVMLVFVVMASALERMRLYQDTFGMTELRFYTTAFMVWLFTVFAWLSFTVLRGRRDRFIFGIFVSGLAVLVVLNAANPDALIIQRSAAVRGDDRPFDSAYALSLSADSVPSFVANFDEVPEAERCGVATELRRRYLDPDDDWRSWSWGRFRAERAVDSSDALARACDSAKSGWIAIATPPQRL